MLEFVNVVLSILSIRSVGDWMICDHGIRECWTEYSEQLFQVDPAAVRIYACGVPVPDSPISENPPILTWVREVIPKLKSGKAAGICGIVMTRKT